MPHLHLSLQAGDDLTLKRMKRRHARANSVAFCEAMRRARPDIVFGADIIAGFPTETEDMFKNSLSLVDDCGLTFLHVFPFSAREGTPAARMPQVNGAIVAEPRCGASRQGRCCAEERIWPAPRDGASTCSWKTRPAAARPTSRRCGSIRVRQAPAR